jgi:hypothetical protein
MGSPLEGLPDNQEQDIMEESIGKKMGNGNDLVWKQNVRLGLVEWLKW